MEPNMVNLKINDIPVTVPEGTTVLEAARAVAGGKPSPVSANTPASDAEPMPSMSFSGASRSHTARSSMEGGKGRNMRQPWMPSSAFTASITASSSPWGASAGSSKRRTASLKASARLHAVRS